MSDGIVSCAAVVVSAAVSCIVMLLYTSPELSWDEADYAKNAFYSWRNLWGRFDYDFHSHGPMMIYLARLGNELLRLPLSIEFRLRFFIVLVSSLGVGSLYWVFRRCFKASRWASLVGTALLEFSVIRVKETNIIGPHSLMLCCTVLLGGLGWQWYRRDRVCAIVGLGTVIGFGALSMTYIIPTTLCWMTAVTLAGGLWISWDRKQLKLSWSLFSVLVVAAAIVLVLWPPGILHLRIPAGFWRFLSYSHHATLVGQHIVEVTPHSAALYWLSTLDLPILVSSGVVIFLGLGRAYVSHRWSSKHTYLIVYVCFFLFTMLAAHLAGPRNLLQLIGVLCLATGALFDEAFGAPIRFAGMVAPAIIVVAALNLFWVSRNYTPSLSAAGYEAFLRENGTRLNDHATAFVAGVPILQFYTRQTGIPLAWNLHELPWTTNVDSAFLAGAKYVLAPAIYDYMPDGQPMRSVVAKKWKVVWSHKVDNVWELRLYQNPSEVAVSR